MPRPAGIRAVVTIEIPMRLKADFGSVYGIGPADASIRDDPAIQTCRTDLFVPHQTVDRASTPVALPRRTGRALPALDET